MSSRTSALRRCLDLASAQRGLVTLDQAVGTGMSPSRVQRLVQAELWTRAHHGLFRIEAYPRSWEQEVMAACMWGGDGTVASHRAAARLLGLGIEWAPVEILRTTRTRAPAPIKAHHTDTLEPVDTSRAQGIPVTSPARTLIDLGAVARRPVVEGAFEAALRLRLTSVWQLIDRLDVLGKPGRRGTATIRQVLRQRDPRLAPTASELESLLWQIISASRLPLPERQFHIFDRDGVIGRVDFAYPEHRLVIEAQSVRWHTPQERLLSDMERRTRLMLIGWRVLEVPWRDIVRRRRTVVERIDQALRAFAVA